MLKYILLGILQGITEFLPISSSGHLVIAQRILQITADELAIFVVLHLATTFALIVFFFKDILRLFHNLKLLGFIVIVTIITGTIGIIGRDLFPRLFNQPKFVASALIFTGIILLLSRKFIDTKRNVLNIKDAFTLGLSQALAIMPGISRSGVTISSLLFRKVDKEMSFRFSFLASIPAVLGATILEAKNIDFTWGIDLRNLFLGFIFSFLAGILSLKVLQIVLRKAKLYYFGYYCIFIAIIVFLFIK